jgi:osmotically-inducible protein OsmY
MLIRIALLIVLLGAAGCGQTIDATMQDAAITAAVKTALLNSPAVDGTLVTVRTEAGVVYLQGVQPSPEAAAEVVAIVRGVSGVRNVESSVTAGAGPGPSEPRPAR